MDKQDYIEQAAKWAERNGFTQIQANTPGYEMPVGFGRSQDGQSFIPDVTGQRWEEKSYFEVILKTANLNDLVSKLNLLYQLTQLRGGAVYLMAPKTHVPFARSVLAKSRIRAEIIALS
ncbi:hypothetical protein [Spirosoma montaniterrae]|uniref:Phage protein n=1 Tax=Spirosoma montaniterrae TaxID=1178516 RepID=A0A1P9WXH5_9BACT|nr:hypothetical protein [Spirosoma montaniterrae]AQG80069.1 hypothetical protein AWR27_12480 [Spirosoma montaniterrae]